MKASTRNAIRRRAAFRCEYCLLPEHVTTVPFHIEHIRARQHGGSEDDSNLALACDRCNLFKGPNLTAIDPLTGTVTPLFNPRTDRWQEHFVRDGATLNGVTSVGRATTSLLRFNDPPRLRLRALVED